MEKMEDVKIIDEVFLSEEKYQLKLQNKFNEIKKILKYLIPSINELLQNEIIYIKNAKLYYDHEEEVFYPDYREYFSKILKDETYEKVKEELKYFGEEIQWDIPTQDELLEQLKKIKSYLKTNTTFFLNKNNILKFKDSECEFLIYQEDSKLKVIWLENDVSHDFSDWIGIPVAIGRGEKIEGKKNIGVLQLMMRKKFIPEGLERNSETEYNSLMKLVNDYSLNFDNDGTVKYYDGKSIKKAVEDGSLKIIGEEELIEGYLNVDKERLDIDEYEKGIVTDINRGHWDLYSYKGREKDVKVKVKNRIYGRNPKKDIKVNGVVGIDFGTKATVVAYQSDNAKITPMRISGGKYNREVRNEDYENPTVIEFRNLESFLKDYVSIEGRPRTKWNDVRVSHAAYDSLINGSSDDYYSVMVDLKQWTRDRKADIRMFDKNLKEIPIHSYMQPQEGDIDPIEFYAYYIGSYINNMYVGGIYLEYLLSFPVTYEKEIKDKILKSFERGLKKSLPVDVLNDKDLMKRFKVTYGAAEPAAYSICALQEYGFDPDEGEKVFYGVFDFGGGTADFDFGIWSGVDRKNRNLDYQIEHFGAGGDKYLGGENILSTLAYEVFKDNQDVCREKNIPFFRPKGTVLMAGYEGMISSSQEAKMNMKQVMEKLRNFWEKGEGYKKEYSSERIKVNLFDKEGNNHGGVSLDIDTEKLDKIIWDKIEKGIKNFFVVLKSAVEKHKDAQKASKVNVFLSGNSSRCSYVEEIFKQEIIEYEKESGKKIKLFPALGTEEADRIIENLPENKRRKYANKIEKPTGKTGVAYGLIEARQGGKIKVINRNEKEMKFGYLVGYAKRGRLVPVLEFTSSYDEWVELIETGDEREFEIYYSESPIAKTNILDLTCPEIIKIRRVLEKKYEDAYIYIRIAGYYKIEYVVATREGIKEDKYLSKIEMIELD